MAVARIEVYRQEGVRGWRDVAIQVPGPDGRKLTKWERKYVEEPDYWTAGLANAMDVERQLKKRLQFTDSDGATKDEAVANLIQELRSLGFDGDVEVEEVEW